MTFSRAVMPRKRRIFWKVRAIPARLISQVDRPTSDRPSSRTSPASGRTNPVMSSKRGLLPAPLGPMIPTISPAPPPPRPPHLPELRGVVARHGAADHDDDVVHPLRAEKVHDALAQQEVGAGQDAETDDLRIFLEGPAPDRLRRLPDAGVDHLHSGIPQRARDHLGAAVVAVEPWLGDDDADQRVHGLSCEEAGGGGPPGGGLRPGGGG